MSEPKSIYDLGNAGIAILEAEIKRMQPVIDAALAWRDDPLNFQHTLESLLAALKAYQEGTNQ